MKHNIPHALSLPLARLVTAKALSSYVERYPEFHPTGEWLTPDRAAFQLQAQPVFALAQHPEAGGLTQLQPGARAQAQHGAPACAGAHPIAGFQRVSDLCGDRRGATKGRHLALHLLEHQRNRVGVCAQPAEPQHSQQEHQGRGDDDLQRVSHDHAV